MGDRELIRKDELREAVEARRELGPAYEDEVLDAFVEKLERRLDERLRTEPKPPAKPNPTLIPVAIASLALGIPITAIAGGTGGAVGIALVWIGIALVNLAAAFGSRH